MNTISNNIQIHMHNDNELLEQGTTLHTTHVGWNNSELLINKQNIAQYLLVQKIFISFIDKQNISVQFFAYWWNCLHDLFLISN